MDTLHKHLYRYLILAVLLILISGTIFYHYVEHWTWVDSLYFCVVTLATVGYGDLTPKSNIGKIFTILYILFGVGIITTYFTAMIHRWKTRFKNHSKNSK